MAVADPDYFFISVEVAVTVRRAILMGLKTRHLENYWRATPDRRVLPSDAEGLSMP